MTHRASSYDDIRLGRALAVAVVATVPLAVATLLAAALHSVTWPSAFACVAAGAFAGLVLLRRDGGGRHQRNDLLGALGARVLAAETQRMRSEEILHELKASVGGVAMASRLLVERRDELAGETVARLEGMRQAEIERLERLLSGDERVAGAVDLHAVISPLVTSLEARGHNVSWHGTAVHATGVADDVAEVVHILLENAVRHAPGSTVDVRVEHDADRVRVVVADDGPGVPAALRATLFDRGVRDVASPGLGIGLHAARRLAHGLGGDLRLEPAVPGRGATFVLTLAPESEDALCHARSA